MRLLKRHLLSNLKSVWAETWWDALRGHADPELLKSLRFDIQDWHHDDHLENFKWHLLPNANSGWDKTWWEALGRHGDSELLKSFRSDIQDGRHGGPLEIVQMASPPGQVGLNLNLMGGIGATWRFRIAKIVPLWYPRWPPWRSVWNSSNHISFHTASLSWNLVEGIGVPWRFRPA